jgi:hypothetical protein
VKGLLDFLFGLLVFACLVLVLWTAILPVIIDKDGFMGSASVPVIIGVGEGPQFEVAFTSSTEDQIREAFVEEAQGTLFLETSNYFLVLLANAAKLVSGIGLAYIFYLLRAVVQVILDGNPFTAENGPRLRRLGYVVLLVGFLHPLAQYIAAAEILKQLPAAVPALNPGPTFNVEVILASLLILVLAHIWSYGLELERDKALTI